MIAHRSLDVVRNWYMKSTLNGDVHVPEIPFSYQRSLSTYTSSSLSIPKRQAVSSHLAVTHRMHFEEGLDDRGTRPVCPMSLILCRLHPRHECTAHTPHSDWSFFFLAERCEPCRKKKRKRRRRRKESSPFLRTNSSTIFSLFTFSLSSVSFFIPNRRPELIDNRKGRPPTKHIHILGWSSLTTPVILLTLFYFRRLVPDAPLSLIVASPFSFFASFTCSSAYVVLYRGPEECTKEYNVDPRGNRACAGPSAKETRPDNYYDAISIRHESTPESLYYPSNSRDSQLTAASLVSPRPLAARIDG